MVLVKIDVSDREGLKKLDFPTLEPGIYELVIKKLPIIVKCKAPSENNMVKVEMHVEVDEVKYVTFDQFVLPYPDCHQVTHARLYQFATCFGVEVGEEGSIDLEEFVGAIGNVRTKQEPKYNDSSKMQHAVSAYLFEDEEKQA